MAFALCTGSPSQPPLFLVSTGSQLLQLPDQLRAVRFSIPALVQHFLKDAKRSVQEHILF
jgi:hypothetical protein